MTAHAKKRWSERFPDMDAENTYSSARYRLTRREMKALRQSLSNPLNRYRTSTDFRGTYIRKTRDGIAFVIKPKDVVITVFKLEPI